MSIAISGAPFAGEAPQGLGMGIVVGAAVIVQIAGDISVLIFGILILRDWLKSGGFDK